MASSAGVQQGRQLGVNDAEAGPLGVVGLQARLHQLLRKLGRWENTGAMCASNSGDDDDARMQLVESNTYSR